MQELHELESAAKIMLATPSMITQVQRSAAEAVFMNFRKTKTPYGLCKHILENSGVDYVLFECGSTLKEALIREWKQLQPQDIVELRQFLFQYTIVKPNLPPYVREKLLQVISIMVKRESVTDFGISRANIIAEVEKLILEGDLQRQTIGCSLLLSLIQEHGNTVKSSDIGLTWETHFKIKKQFEVSDLKKILTICVRALTELSNLPADTLLKQILALTEAVFSWGFVTIGLRGALPRRLVGAFEENYEAEQYPTLRLKVHWKEIILEKNIVNLFFDVYWKIRDNPHLAHYALNCLVPLASLNGPIVGEKEQRAQYFCTYIELFIKLITNIKVLDREALGIANIIKNIAFSLPPIVAHLPPILVKTFVENVTKLTCFFSEEGNDYSENGGTYAEGLDTLLRVWLTWSVPNKILPDELLSQPMWQVFHTYIKSCLAPPYGNRRPTNDNEEEEDPDERLDRMWLKEQLLTIGHLGRQAPMYSLPLLAKLLEDRTQALKNLMEEVATGKQDPNKVYEWLVPLYDDLHWIILISSYVLTLEGEGELSIIPSEIMNHSINQKAPVDITMKTLVSNISELSSVDESCDHIVRIVAAMLRLSELEMKINEIKLKPGFSSQIAENIVWFFRVWSYSYLLPRETYYSEISMALNCAFGQNSEGSVWVVNNLIRKIQFNLRYYRTDVSISEETIQFLVSIFDTREERHCILKSESFWALVEWFQSQDRSLNIKFVNSGVIKALVLGGVLLSKDKHEEYWGQIIKPIVNRFNEILSMNNFKKIYHELSIRTEIQTILELLIGVGQGGHVKTVHSLFAILSPVLTQCSHLTGLYCNYKIIIEDIFQLFYETASSFVTYLTPVETRSFFESCLNIIQMYARTNFGRKSSDPNAEEDTFSDIEVLMKLLTAIYSKDMIDLCPSAENAQDPSLTLAASDVCMYGLKILMPLMTVELLKCPTLSILYYKIVAYICDLYPKNIINQEPALLEGILQSVQLGLQSFGKEVASLCCEFIYNLSKYVYESELSRSFRLLVPFIEILLDMTLCRQVNSDCLANTGRALFALMCCYQEDYERRVRFWLDSQSDPEIAQRLADSFTQLTANLTLSIHRTSVGRFRESFEKFVVEVPGFLLVK